jgi:hypothetical protein
MPKKRKLAKRFSQNIFLYGCRNDVIANEHGQRYKFSRTADLHSAVKLERDKAKTAKANKYYHEGSQ